MLFIQALSFALGAAALSVTAPTEGSSIPQSSDLAITWSRVSTDTQTFNIQLALSTDSGNAQTLTRNVASTTNGYTTPASAFAPGNYTVNLVGDSATSSGVLAQSKWFLITAAAVSSSAQATSANGASTLGASTASAIASQASVSAGASGAAAGAAAPTAGVSGSARASGSGSASARATAPTSTTGAADKTFASVAALLFAGCAALLF